MPHSKQDTCPDNINDDDPRKTLLSLFDSNTKLLEAWTIYIEQIEKNLSTMTS